jgi:hypothetical protein
MRRSALISVLVLIAAAPLSGCGQEDANESDVTSADYVADQAEVAEGAAVDTLHPRYYSGGYAPAQVEDDEDRDDEAASTPREPFDEDEARSNAEAVLASENYRSIGRPYGCTDDCSGHEAGFKYRAQHGYGNRIAGDYDARSFRQGQQAYDDEVDRRVDEAREEYESAEE